MKIWRVKWAHENNYNEDFIQCNTHRPTTTTEANDNATHTTTATIPYIKGISENISRILQPFNIRVAHKPITTLRQLLTNIKDKDEPRNRQGAVYKINCSDCHTSYISETGYKPTNHDRPIMTDIYHLSLTANSIMAKLTGLGTFDWQQPFTWLWWWLLLRLSKCQSPYQEQSFSVLHSPGRSNYNITYYPWVQTIYCIIKDSLIA